MADPKDNGIMRGARCWLFTPGTRAGRVASGLSAGADRIILDLDDAIAPADKDPARHAVLAFLNTAPEAVRQRCALRLNSLDTLAGLDDMRAVLAADLGSAATWDSLATARAGILAAAAQGVGVVSGRIVDEAMARQARRLLARAGES